MTYTPATLDTPLAGRDLKRWTQACSDNVVNDGPLDATYAVALSFLSQTVHISAENTARCNGIVFRKQFAKWSQDIWKPARAILKPADLTPAFSCDTMLQQWTPTWSPTGFDVHERMESWD